MKTAAKVFIIIGMVGGFWCIFPIILGAIALKKMSNGKPSVGFSVCVLLFVSTLGGIFLLCSRPEEYPAEVLEEAPAEQSFTEE